MNIEKLERLKTVNSNYILALNHFNNAEKEFIDEAITNLNLALETLNSVRLELGMSKVEL